MDNTQPRRSSRLLIHEHPLQVLPSLACAIGLNEAMFLQQVHYWISRPEAHERDGRRWVYNSYPQWHEQFPFWGINTIRRTIETLEKHGLLLTGNYNTSAIDRTKWYSIDYDAVDALGHSPSAEKHRPSAHFGQTNISEWADDVPDMGRPIPETNTETNNRESAPAPATGDISPQPPSSNGHTSNGSSSGRHMNARPVLAADETPPPVVVKIPPGTPVNRRPDAPAVRPVPKPDPASKQLAKWFPPDDFTEWYAEVCTARKREPTSINLVAELQKFRVHPSTTALAPGQWDAHWQIWILRAFDGMGQPRGTAAGPTPPRRRHVDEVDL